MKRIFSIYQYVAPLAFFPLSYYLWVNLYDGNHKLTMLTLSMPIIFAYVIPGIGTNKLKLWEFNTRLKIGRYRPHHGFVFGTATSLFALLCLDYQDQNIEPLALIRAGFVMGTTLAFWNWLYDVYAIKAGFIKLHRQPYHKDASSEAIVMEYAPILFGTFGVCYGIWLQVCWYYLVYQGRDEFFWWLFLAGNLAGLIVPVVAFSLFSYAKHGVSGLRAYKESDNEN